MTKHLLLATLLAIALPSQGLSQTAGSGAPIALTLDAAVRRGLEVSHRLVEAVARQEAAEAVADQQHSASLPQVGAQASYMRTNHVQPFGVPFSNNVFVLIYPDIPNNYLSRIDARWPIYTGGRLAASERAARVESAAQREDVRVLRADLRLEIVRVYWSFMTAIESVRVVQDSLERTRAHLVDARNQLAVGLIGPSDVLSIEAQESRYRMLIVQAEVARDGAETELARLIGAAPGVRIEPVSDPALPAVVEGDADTLVSAARRQRPERAALVERVAAADARVTAAAAGRKPTVTVGGGYDYAWPNPKIFPRRGEWQGAWDASISASFPLLDGGRVDATVGEASASARAAQARLAEFDSVVDVEVRQRSREVESSRAAIAAADDAVRAASEARRVAGERFVAGVATSTDVLVAQGAVLQAGLDRTQALANARLAEARLARAVGDPP